MSVQVVYVSWDEIYWHAIVNAIGRSNFLCSRGVSKPHRLPSTPMPGRDFHDAEDVVTPPLLQCLPFSGPAFHCCFPWYEELLLTPFLAAQEGDITEKGYAIVSSRSLSRPPSPPSLA